MPPKPAKRVTLTPFLSRRLAAQRIAQSTLDSPAEVVASLGAVQAQDHAGAQWAVGLRLARATPTVALIEQALAEGSILRTHLVRWTWQLVSPADVRWMLALVAPRLIARYQWRHDELELDAKTFRRSRSALERALGDGQHLTRDELGAVLERAKISAVGPRLSHLLSHAELEGVITSGSPRGKRPTYASLDLRAPNARPVLSRDEGLAELAKRYFESRGPATVADFAWWSGLTMGDANRGLAAVESTLVSEKAEGMATYRSEASTTTTIASPFVALLPAFDEYLIAYRDRDGALDREHVKRLNAGGGMLDPSIVVDGRIAGVWRRKLSRRAVSVAVRLFGPLGTRERAALEVAVNRYGEFLGLSVEHTIEE